jgi:transposase
MGRKGSWYTLEEKRFYIGLVREKGWACRAVQREYGIKDTQVRQWIERFEASGVEGLKPRILVGACLYARELPFGARPQCNVRAL